MRHIRGCISNALQLTIIEIVVAPGPPSAATINGMMLNVEHISRLDQDTLDKFRRRAGLLGIQGG